MGYVQRPETEYQIFRYESYGRAANNLAQLMAVCGPYNPDDMWTCMSFLMRLEETPEESYDVAGEQLFFCETEDVMFVIGKFDDIKTDPGNGMTFKVIQDHRHCSPEHCFGDIAEMN